MMRRMPVWPQLNQAGCLCGRGFGIRHGLSFERLCCHDLIRLERLCCLGIYRRLLGLIGVERLCRGV